MDKNIVDAEVVTTDESTEPPAAQSAPVSPQAFDINAYNATIEVVRRRLVIIEQAKEELKKLKEMHDDAFANDPLYKKSDELVKEATQKRKDIMNEMAKQAAIAEVIGKMKDLKEQLKSNTESLADELMEYYRTAGVMEIEDENGNVQEFVISIKLKPKASIT